MLSKFKKLFVYSKAGKVSVSSFINNTFQYLYKSKKEGYRMVNTDEFNLIYRYPQQQLPLLLLLKKPNELEFYYFKQLLGSFKLIVDIGGGIGSFSIPCLKYFKGNIFAFEPHILNFHTLKMNIQLNNAEQIITPINKAISVKSGIKELYINDDNFYLNSINTDFGGRTISVETISLDEFAIQNNISFVDLLKIDTEGHELNVLSGCEELLRKNLIKYLIIERNGDLEEIFQIMNGYGYKASILNNQIELIALNSFQDYNKIKDKAMTSNIVFTI